MALKDKAIFGFGLHYVRMFALNDDNTTPTPTNIIGGVGPFDMSDATIAAVPITIKIDDASAIEIEVDLTAAVAPGAVTAAEIVTAVTTAFAAETPAVDVTASVDGTSNRIKFVADTAGVIALQVYGDLAEYSMIGQGFGIKYLTSDTIRTMTETANRKAGETIATTDAWGVDTTVVTDGYYKGFSAPIVDTAEDWEMFALCEGLHLNASGGMSSPTSETIRPMIGANAFYGKYLQGENRETELVGYREIDYKYCKGMGGDKTHERGFSDSTYTLEGTTHRDAVTKIVQPAWDKIELTVAQFNALLIESI
jgi:hypothetical protein